MNPLTKIPVLREFLLFGYRTKIALAEGITYLSKAIAWLFRSNETTNYTYHLTDANMAYLSCFIADVTNVPRKQIEAYMQELQQDHALKEQIIKGIVASPDGYKADKDVRYGKRLGWYAFVRALKPRIIVETGVDKGLGSCVLTAALLRNAQEGHPGQYYGTDINPRAGYLLQPPYKQYGEILYGDSIESLSKFDKKIDLFINDSDHSAEYEAREYTVIADKMSPNGIILGDNCEVTTKLYEFAEQTGRKFLFFREEPLNHWFPGGGIGIAMPPR